MTRRGPLVVACLAVALALAALEGCGQSDTGGTVVEGGSSTSSGAGGGTSTTGSGGSSGTSGGAGVTLTVVRSDPGAPGPATLTCDGSSATGTGALADPAAAQAACAVVTGNPRARDRLLNGQAKGILCTQLYGGPEKAMITGTIDGQPVNATFHRTDGCGTADWGMLQALLGTPDA